MRGGRRPGAGRPEGIPNKITKEVRDVLHDFTTTALKELPTMFKGLETDRERIDVLIRLLPYVAPRLQTIAIQEEPQEPQKIIIEYVSPKNEDDD